MRSTYILPFDMADDIRLKKLFGPPEANGPDPTLGCNSSAVAKRSADSFPLADAARSNPG
jgi:hypothetical protein